MSAEGKVIRRVLLVDDEPLVLRSVSRLLTPTFDIVTAGGAEEAVRAIESAPFDAVITDYHLRGRTGAWFLGFLQVRYPDVRRILTSASEIEDLDILMRSGRVEAFLPKPAIPKEIRATLRRRRKGG